MRSRSIVTAALATATIVAAVLIAPASALPRFDDERSAGFDINPKHQSNWEPTVAVDPNHPDRVYQLTQRARGIRHP